MSHPFTLEYMQASEILPDLINGEIKRPKEDQERTHAHENPMLSSVSSRVCESGSVTEGCEANLVEENSDGEMGIVREEMTITITDEERLGFLKILGMAMRRRIEIFAEEVSILGMSYLVKPSSHQVGSIIRKIVWTMLLLLGTCFMVFQIYDCISFYLTHPTTVSYRVAYNQSLRFPTVTICSEIMASKKALSPLGSVFEDLPSIRYKPVFDLSPGESFPSLNFSELNFDWEFVYSYVIAKMKDMILECSFKNLPCDSSGGLKTTVIGPEYCLTFNPVTANSVTNHPGADYGLRLVLWANQSDAFLVGTAGVGFQVALHDPRDVPYGYEIGFRVGTGISTSVSFSLRNLSMLPSPYGDCRDTEDYTFQRCISDCSGNFVLSRCGCRLIVSDASAPVCNLEQYYRCVPESLRSWITSGACRKCDCPLQCYQPTYPYSVSTSPLSEQFLNYISQRSQFKGRNLTTSRLSKELTYLDIFYSELSYVDIQTTPTYDFLNLVCDIGGALGLILGGTLLTVVEFAQLFVQLFSEIVASAKFARMQR